jgi:phage tail sheath gpL-like
MKQWIDSLLSSNGGISMMRFMSLVCVLTASTIGIIAVCKNSNFEGAAMLVTPFLTAAFAGICTATSAAAVVTVQAAVKGYIGNCITLASSNGSRLAVSAARLASGTGNGEAGVTYAFGKA